MLESGSSGSVRGVLSNEHPYRDPRSFSDLGAVLSDVRFTPDIAEREHQVRKVPYAEVA